MQKIVIVKKSVEAKIATHLKQSEPPSSWSSSWRRITFNQTSKEEPLLKQIEQTETQWLTPLKAQL